MHKIRNVLVGVVVTVVVLVAAAGWYLAYRIHVLQSKVESPVITESKSKEVSVPAETDGDVRGLEKPATVAETVPVVGFTVLVASLPPAQQSVVRTLGFTETITFTPSMVMCAEEKLGTARLNEIKQGAAPTVFESANLLSCL